MPTDLAAVAATSIHLHAGPDYAKRVDRLREGFFGSIGRMWRADLRRHGRKLLSSNYGATTIDDLADRLVENAARHYEAQEPYEKTYATVVPFFAERVYDGLTGSSKIIPLSDLHAILRDARDAHRTPRETLKARSESMRRVRDDAEYAEMVQDLRVIPGSLHADPALVEEWVAAALRWVRSSGGSLIKAVEGFSHREVVRIVRKIQVEAIENGWSISRFKRGIGRELNTMADYRARRIARTETMRASNIGSREGAKATELKLEKEWLTGPSGTGDRHATGDYPNLNGQKRKMDDYYDVGGHAAMYPLDTILPVGESVNCRCSEVYNPI